MRRYRLRFLALAMHFLLSFLKILHEFPCQLYQRHLRMSGPCPFKLIEEQQSKKSTLQKGIVPCITGGNAWLELENEDDIFSSGITYMIQFKDKPKRTSTSISGGEKTLAAVVFVLALQKLKPSPFYLFDEIDAHLDAPNSEKLANIIEERSKGSHFLMVSLKDSVVEKAKLIYGVYPKNGVSHIVTYKDKRLPSMIT